MTSIKISKRLKCIANMVDKSSTIADIGCDHALLDIYLIQNKIVKKAIACDIKEGAINQAKKNITNYSISNIDTRLADGLSAIKKTDKVNTIIISGLGNQKIISILQDGKKVLDNIKSIIIQSNTSVDKVRLYLTGNGFYIENEKLVKEKDIIYTIIKFKKGFKKYSKKELFYGPVLLKNKDDVFNELLNSMLTKNKIIVSKLPKTKIIKKIKIIIKNNQIKKEMFKK